MSSPAMTTHIVDRFDDPLIAPPVWGSLLAKGDADCLFLTWEWQKTWWDVFARGELRIVVASQDGVPIAIAPLFYDGKMLFFVGSGGSDYLDFIGETAEEGLLTSLLEAARHSVDEFVGFRFYHVPEWSQTAKRLQEVSRNLGLELFDEGDLPAPLLGISRDLAMAHDVTRKKSLLQSERYFLNHGSLVVKHVSRADEILPSLDAFFRQHINRWSETPYPSLFLDPNWRRFYKQLAVSMTDRDWIRFTQIDWNDQPIAFHFGFFYREEFLYYKPTFEIQLAKRSPGQVLLRQLILAAIAEGARIFDFGLGDEPFKQRFATLVRSVRTWGLYPKEALV
jgi:CelD/BcsL family acetyltransferase involved in cellulose biosynthesis